MGNLRPGPRRNRLSRVTVDIGYHPQRTGHVTIMRPVLLAPLPEHLGKSLIGYAATCRSMKVQ